LGFSMTIDYKTHKTDIRTPFVSGAERDRVAARLYRLATVRGVVSGGRSVNFVVDTAAK